MFDDLSDEELLLAYNKLYSEIKQDSWNLFVEYNIIDTVLVDELEDKLKLFRGQNKTEIST